MQKTLPSYYGYFWETHEYLQCTTKVLSWCLKVSWLLSKTSWSALSVDEAVIQFLLPSMYYIDHCFARQTYIWYFPNIILVPLVLYLLSMQYIHSGHPTIWHNLLSLKQASRPYQSRIHGSDSQTQRMCCELCYVHTTNPPEVIQSVHLW